jgi:hypothetical protein
MQLWKAPAGAAKLIAGLGALAVVAAALPASTAAADGPILAPQPTPITINLGQNLIVNGGFEDPIAWPWWLGAVERWNPPLGTVVVDTAQHHCGTHSLHFGVGDSTAYYRVAIPTTASHCGLDQR